ncbi:MAG: PEP-CTERM sorting domain-containing protein [Microcoleaceae cyanobacterium]
MKLSAFVSSVLATTGVVVAATTGSADAFSVNFGSTSQSSNTPATGASALVDFIFSDVAGGVELKLDIANTTGSTSFGSGATTSKLTGIAFDVLSGITASAPGGTGSAELDTFLSDVAFSPFSNSAGFGAVGNFSYAVADNNNFEGGNANDALSQGNSTIATLLLATGGLNASQVEAGFLTGFSNSSLSFAARFQQVAGLSGYDGSNSEKLLGGTINNPGNEEPVPEPLTILGSATALGVGTILKRKAAKKS